MFIGIIKYYSVNENELTKLLLFATIKRVKKLCVLKNLYELKKMK